MSIRVQGTIVISRKKGRRGEFNVGELRTEIGEFEVKDALIEEYDEGSYSGDFFIDWIEPESFTWRGRVFIKNRAQLAAIVIDEVDTDAGAMPQQPPTADPVDETRGMAQQMPAARQAPMPDSPPAEAPLARSEAQGADIASRDAPPSELSLFDAEIAQRIAQSLPVKLDPTVDRIAFRAQRDQLKNLGYRFDAMSQTWSIDEAAHA